MTSSSGNLYSKRENGLTSFGTKGLELWVDWIHPIPPNSVSVLSTAQVCQYTINHVLLRNVHAIHTQYCLVLGSWNSNDKSLLLATPLLKYNHDVLTIFMPVQLWGFWSLFNGVNKSWHFNGLESPRTKVLYMTAVEASSLACSMLFAYKNKLCWQ
jgi:hypothetical protein